MATQIKLRRDTVANWLLEDPILGQGEPGFETDTGKLKIGDGTSTWSQLDYIVAENDGSIDLGAVDKHLLPATDNTYDLGSPAKQWRHGYFANGSLYIGDIKLSNDEGQLVVQQVTDAGLISEAPVPNTPGVVTTDRIVNGNHSFSITSTGVLKLDGNTFTGGGSGSSDRLVNGSLDLIFNNEGALVFPAGAKHYDLSAGDSILSHNIEVNNKTWAFNVQGFISLPNGNVIDTGVANKFIMETGGDTDFEIFTIGAGNTPLTSTWTFGRNGTLKMPPSTTGASYQLAPTTEVTVATGAAPTVVYTSTGQYINSMKAIISVFSPNAPNQAGDQIIDTQVCEMLITTRYSYINNTGTVTKTAVATVYGITHTSDTPLATFTVNLVQSVTGGNIQILAQPTGLVVSEMDVQVVATEILGTP